MQASYAGPLASYNSLTDEHLAEHFSNPRNFKHLRRMGLITRDGRIVDEGIIRVNNARKEHKARSKGVLATSIINRAIEIERKRRGQLKKKLELLEKYEVVEKVKSQKLHPTGIQEFNPYRTVPPPPPRLSMTLDMHFDKLSLSTDQISDMRHLVGKITRSRSIPPRRAKSPYEEELSSRYSTPVPRPPSTPRPSTAMNVRGRRSTIRNRPSTAPAGTRQSAPRQMVTRSQPVHSNVSITLKFVGTGLHLDKYAMESPLSDVMVLQQHCGGNTLPLYKGKVKPKEIFTFVSKRHIGMPYGLTIYLDGMMDSRVSACCEYRHQCGRLLGSKTAHFKLIKVEGGKPCYRCEIELNKRHLREKQDKEIEMVLGETSSIQELVSPEENATRDEDPPVIDDSPIHSTSQTSQGGLDQLECQESDTLHRGSLQQDEHSDIEEKASLASHSNASVGSMKSKSSRVSVASSKSSIHSRESVVSKTSSRSSKSSIPNRKNSSQSSSNHSLVKMDSSEVPAASERSSHSLSPSGSAVLSKEKGVESEAADADTEYNYDDDNFEEPEEVDPKEVEEPKQQLEEEQLEDTDPELSKENELSDSDPTNVEYSHGDGENKELNTEEPIHQTGKQADETDTALSKEEQMSDTKPDKATDIDTEYDYENDKFEETNPEETDEPKQQPEEHESLKDVAIETSLSVTEPVEGKAENVRESSTPVSNSKENESNTENVNADLSNDAKDHQIKDVITDSSINNDTEEKVPTQQSSSNDIDAETQGTVEPESDPNNSTKPQDNDTENVTQEPGNKEIPIIKELQASESRPEDVISEDKSHTSAVSGDTQETQVESKDKADMSKNQQGLSPQGILLTKSGRKPTRLSVSFEAASDTAKLDEQPSKDLSASFTIEEAKNVLQKSQSTASLGSLLSEKENSALGSSLDLSGSEDEDIPDLEQKISDLIDGDSSEIGDKAELQENAETMAPVKENEKERVDSNGSEDKVVERQENTIPQPVPESEKETVGTEEKAEDVETAVVPESEKESIEQPSEERGENQDKTPTNSQTEMAKEVTEISGREGVVEDQGINSQTETVKEAEVKENMAPDITSQEVKVGAEEETRDQQQPEQKRGEPEPISVPVESANVNDDGSVRSGLSSSSSKSSLTSVSSQSSQRS